MPDENKNRAPRTNRGLVECGPDVAEQLDKMIVEHGLASRTAVVCRAVAVLRDLLAIQAGGGQLVIREKDGKERSVMFL